ncbi:C45 family peptidase [Acrocarpospora sp. B8E8]|uniref:C45 family peptidase n=1 Tax=Acrocarpospora sp. B8E8 TaxID=3153572 RepID=UPI00325E60C5
MTVRHLRTDALDPYIRGEELGRRMAAEIATNVRDYERLFEAVKVTTADLPALGSAAIDQVRAWAPSLVREWEGLAAGSGLDLWRIGVLNARTEILATVKAIGEGECSVAVYAPGQGSPRSVQTWDWHDAFESERFMVTHSVEGGTRLRYFTEAGLTGKIGIAARDRGSLGLHLNILHHSSDGDGLGVPVHAVMRRVLECADSLESAIDIARSAAVSASSALTVVGYEQGRSWAATLEICPDGVAVVPPDEEGFLVHTNHFIDPTLAEGDLMPESSDTWDRMAVLGRRRELLRSSLVDERFAFLRRHAADGGAVCCHPNPELAFEHRWRSLITIDLDYDQHAVRHVDAGPCQHDVLGHRTF